MILFLFLVQRPMSSYVSRRRTTYKSFITYGQTTSTTHDARRQTATTRATSFHVTTSSTRANGHRDSTTTKRANSYHASTTTHHTSNHNTFTSSPLLPATPSVQSTPICRRQDSIRRTKDLKKPEECVPLKSLPMADIEDI